MIAGRRDRRSRWRAAGGASARSTAMPRSVLMAHSASAPSSSAARPTSRCRRRSARASPRAAGARARATRARPRRAPPGRSRGCRPTPGRFGLDAFSSSATMPGAPSRRGRDVGELLGAVAPEVGDDARSAARSAGSRSRQERLDADVLEADRVQHAAGRLDQARRRLARRRAQREPLHADRAERARGRRGPRTRCRSRRSPRPR